jgi:hypothetical protein
VHRRLRPSLANPAALQPSAAEPAALVESGIGASVDAGTDAGAQTGTEAGVNEEGFFDTVNNFVDNVSNTVGKVSDGIVNVVTKVRGAVDVIRGRSSGDDSAAKAEQWGQELGAQVGAKVGEISKKVGTQYGELFNGTKLTTDAMNRQLWTNLKTINNRTSDGLGKATKYLELIHGRAENKFQADARSSEAVFQGQSWMNLNYLQDQLGMTQTQILKLITQLRDQGRGFREMGTMPKALVVTTKGSKQIVVGTVQGGVTPLVQYTGEPEGGGLYIGKDGSAYKSGGVITQRQPDNTGPQAYVGGHGLIYNNGATPVFDGAALLSAQKPQPAFKYTDIYKQHGLNKLLYSLTVEGAEELRRLAELEAARKASSGSAVQTEAGKKAEEARKAALAAAAARPETVKLTPPAKKRPSKKNRDEVPDAPDVDPSGKPYGEGWVQTTDENGKPVWARETTVESSKSSEMSSSVSNSVNPLTQGVLGGRYKLVKGNYDQALIGSIFAQSADDNGGDKLIQARDDTADEMLGAQVRRADMEQDRFSL